MKKSLTGVDIFKLLAALGVVAIHTGMPLFLVLGRIGVPFFVIISSYFFFRHYLMLDTYEAKKYLKKFIFRIGMLFLSWEIFYIPLTIHNNSALISQNKGKNSIYIICKIIFDFFYPVPSNGNGWGPSWYLLAIIAGVPIFVFVCKLLKNNLILLGLISLIIELYYVLANGYGFLTHLSTLGTYAFPRIIVYIFLGLLLVHFSFWINRININYISIISFALIILFLVENFLIKKYGGISNSEEVFTTVPTSFSITVLSLKWNPNINNTIKYRNFSTFLYCFQEWPLVICGKYLHFTANYNLTGIIKFIIIILTTFLFFKLYIIVKEKTKWIFLSYMV